MRALIFCHLSLFYSRLFVFDYKEKFRYHGRFSVVRFVLRVALASGLPLLVWRWRCA